MKKLLLTTIIVATISVIISSYFLDVTVVELSFFLLDKGLQVLVR